MEQDCSLWTITLRHISYKLQHQIFLSSLRECIFSSTASPWGLLWCFVFQSNSLYLLCIYRKPLIMGLKHFLYWEEKSQVKGLKHRLLWRCWPTVWHKPSLSLSTCCWFQSKSPWSRNHLFMCISRVPRTTGWSTIEISTVEIIAIQFNCKELSWLLE